MTFEVVYLALVPLSFFAWGFALLDTLSEPLQ